MNLNNYFDISRFWLLLKIELFRSRKALLMTFVITFGALFFIDLLLGHALEESKIVHDHSGGYAFTLLIGGFVLSSFAFNDLANPLRKYNYLVLPASTFEKFLSMWLLTSIGWIILFTITYTVYTWIANEVGYLLFTHVTFEKFSPFGDFELNTMKSYFVLQGIFLVGASHFKGYVLPKTLFVLILFAIIVGVTLYFSLEDLFRADHECEILGNSQVECILIDTMASHTIFSALVWFFWWGLAPLCWLTAFFGLKDKEA